MTRQQLELREKYKNPRIGACRLQHCRTLMPMKWMFGGFCYLHSKRVSAWLVREGLNEHDPAIASELYTNALKSRARRIWPMKVWAEAQALKKFHVCDDCVEILENEGFELEELSSLSLIDHQCLCCDAVTRNQHVALDYRPARVKAWAEGQVKERG